MKGILIEKQYHFKNRTNCFQDLKDPQNTNLSNINIINDFACSKKLNLRK